MPDTSKEEIIQALCKSHRQLDRIVTDLAVLDDTRGQEERDLVMRITHTMFEFMDSIGNIEVDLYNYMKRRGES